MNFFKTKTQHAEKTLCAVCQGKSVELSAMPDEAFSSGILGKGFAILPESNEFVSPVNGRVESVAETRHAYTLLTDDGLDILIHIGVDTVQLHGEGFEALVSAGQRVEAGDPLARADLSLIREKGFDPITAVLVTNSEKIGQLNFKFGNTAAGDSVMTFRLSGKG